MAVAAGIVKALKLTAATQPAEAAAEVLGLTLPVQVTEANLISDGGTTAMQLVDAGNRTLHVFTDGRELSGPSPPPRHPFTGAYPGKEGSNEQPISGRTEQAVLALLRAWMNRQADPERQARLRAVESVVGLSKQDVKLLRVIRVIGKLFARAQPEVKWGQAANGLRCGLTADKAEVPMGAKVDFILHLEFDPKTADPKVEVLDRTGPHVFNVTLGDQRGLAAVPARRLESARAHGAETGADHPHVASTWCWQTLTILRAGSSSSQMRAA